LRNPKQFRLLYTWQFVSRIRLGDDICRAAAADVPPNEIRLGLLGVVEFVPIFLLALVGGLSPTISTVAAFASLLLVEAVMRSAARRWRGMRGFRSRTSNCCGWSPGSWLDCVLSTAPTWRASRPTSSTPYAIAQLIIDDVHANADVTISRFDARAAPFWQPFREFFSA